jgi:hypothetical protein
MKFSCLRHLKEDLNRFRKMTVNLLNPMKNILTSLLLSVAVVSYAQNAKNELKGAALLQHAYKTNSITELNKFFANWQKDEPSLGDGEITKLSDTEKQAYAVFMAFYRPLDINSLGGSEFGKDIYNNVKYLIIQPQVKIYSTGKIVDVGAERDSIAVQAITKSSLPDSLKTKYLKRIDGKLSAEVLADFASNFDTDEDRKDTLVGNIINFRPQIKCGDKLPLYLTSKYDTLLNAFLGSTYLPLGAGGIMNPARSNGESLKREKFLDHLIKVWYGHWGGYWQLYSYPQVYSITFDKQMHRAEVNFRFIYEGGKAILENKNGQWKLLSSQRTWIE